MSGWVNVPHHSPVVESVGFIRASDDTDLVLALSMSGQDGMLDELVIPWGMVAEIHSLGILGHLDRDIRIPA